MKATFLGILLGLGLSCALVLPAEAAPLTLKAAVERTLGRHPDVLAAKEKINETDANASQVFSSVFPELSASFAANNRKDALNIGNPLFGGNSYSLYDARLNVKQPIYHGGALYSGIRVAQKESVLKALDLEIARRDVTLRVVESFYGMVFGESKLKALLEQKDIQTELLRISEDRYRTGRSSKLEVLQLKADLAMLDPQILDAQNQIKVSGADLANLLGEREARELQVAGKLDPLDWKAVMTERASISGRIPELIRNSTAQDQLKEQRTYELSKNWPQLDLLGNWGRSAYVKSDLFDSYSTNWVIGLQLSVPIFSGLSSVYQRQALTSRESQLQIDLTRLQDKLALDQISVQKDLDSALARIDASATALKFSTEAMKQAKYEFRLGTTNYLQLNDAEKRYISAISAHDQALYDAIIAEARYYSASGWPLNDFVDRISASVHP